MVFFSSFAKLLILSPETNLHSELKLFFLFRFLFLVSTLNGSIKREYVVRAPPCGFMGCISNEISNV